MRVAVKTTLTGLALWLVCAATVVAERVSLIKIDGAIGPATASYISRSIEEARAQIAARSDLAALFIPHVGDPIVLGRLPLIPERAAVRVVVTPQSGRTP